MENWESSLHTEKLVRTVLVNMSKPFGRMLHGLFIPILHIYDFVKYNLTVIFTLKILKITSKCK